MKPVLFVVIICLTFGCNLKLDKSAKNNFNNKKNLSPCCFSVDGYPLSSVIENVLNTLGKIDAYAGEFNFGNNAVTTGHTIFSKKYVNT